MENHNDSNLNWDFSVCNQVLFGINLKTIMSSRFSCTISIYISIRGLLLFLLQKRLICWLTIKMFMYSRKHIHVCMQAIAFMYLTGNENSHSLRYSHNWNFLLVMLWRKFSDWILNPVFTLLNFIYISILLTRAKWSAAAFGRTKCSFWPNSANRPEVEHGCSIWHVSEKIQST